MKWDAMQTEARENGYLVFAMHQSETLFVEQSENLPGQWGRVGGGYGLGAACHWLWDMHRGETFRHGLDKVCRLPPLKAVRMQAIHNKDNEGEWSKWDAILGEYAMRRDTSTSWEETALKAPKHEELAHKLANVTRSIGGYTFDFHQGQHKHSMAMFRSAGELNLFDADHGHFRFADAEHGIDWFLDKTLYARIDKWTARVCKIIGPKKPSAPAKDDHKKKHHFSWRPEFDLSIGIFDFFRRPKDFEFEYLPSEKIKLAPVEEIDPPLKVLRPKTNPGEKKP